MPDEEENKKEVDQFRVGEEKGQWQRVSQVYRASAIYVFYLFYMFSSSNIQLKNAHFQLDTWIAASCMWLEI